MATKNESHRTKDALVLEIKKLRGEVGVLAKRHNDAKREIEDLVKRVRSQPPPPIPKRDEETEKKEEQKGEWTEHLQKEIEEEKLKQEKEKKERKEAEDIVVSEDTQLPTGKKHADNTLSPVLTPLDQCPQLPDDNTINETLSPVITHPDRQPNPPGQTHLKDSSNNVEIADKKEKEEEIDKIASWKVGREWLDRYRRMTASERSKEREERAKNWKWAMKCVGREDEEVNIRWLNEQAEKVLEERRKQHRGTTVQMVDAWCCASWFGDRLILSWGEGRDTLHVMEVE